MSEEGLSESEIITIISERASSGGGLTLGIGDDAAMYHFNRPDVLLTVDSLYEGTHFDLSTHHLSDVGWKAAAVNISDIAAMGGTPDCALLSLAWDRPPTRRELNSLIGGMTECLFDFGCALAGGDTCRSEAGLSLTVTVAGTPPPSGPIERSGASPGDVVLLTGTVGDSAAGLYILKSGVDELSSEFPLLAESHLRPRPRVREGELIASSGATAMVDVSDGLARDMRNICQASGVGCELLEETVPMSPGVLTLAARVGVDPLSWALGGGEDYQLLFTVSASRLRSSVEELTDSGVEVTRLGEITETTDTVILTRDGKRKDLGGIGYEHFS